MTLGYKTEDFEKTRMLHMRNATIPIGCACVMDTTLVRLEALIQHFVEKRGKTTKKEISHKFKPMKKHPSMERGKTTKKEISHEFKPMKRHPSMEDGGVDTTVKDRQQQKKGKMAEFPPLLASSIIDLYKHDTPQFKSKTMRPTLMNLVNTTFFEKYVNP